MNSRPYLKRALFWLVTTTALYLVMNGAQIFETVLIVPKWTAAPPASLAMFQGEVGLDFKAFWIVFHSLHELTFILALVYSWKLRVVRPWIVGLLIIHMAVRVWTVAYFAPTIIAFQRMPYSATIDPGLVEKAAQWRARNIIRVVLFGAVNCALFFPLYRVARMICTADWRGDDGGWRDSLPSGLGRRGRQWIRRVAADRAHSRRYAVPCRSAAGATASGGRRSCAG
jgi:hypothetical protein